MTRSVGSKHPYLTIFHFPQRATVLPRHAHGVLALFDKARLIKHQHALGGAHLVRHQAMVGLAHMVFIPDVIAHAALHPPDVAPFDVERHRLDRFACEGTALADHVVEEVLAGLTPRKTCPEVVVKSPKFIKKSVNILGGELKLGDGERLAFRSICREHSLPPE